MVNSKRTKRNLDDFGNKEIDSFSLLVVGEGFQQAVDISRKCSLDVGLHLSLTDPYRSYRKFLWMYFTGQISKTYIYNEWDKQINKFLETGLPLERIDSHHGVHYLPGCWKILIGLMLKYNITYVRNPKRKFCWFCPNPKLWISRIKSWIFYKINKCPFYINPLPYEEELCHIK